MESFVFVLIPIGLLLTAIILGIGIYSLAKGGTFSKNHSNKLMRMRVAAQAITVGLMMLFLFLISRGG